MTAKRRMPIFHDPIPLLNDLVFHTIFGERDGLPCLKAMLNAFFAYSGQKLVVELDWKAPVQ